MGDTTMRTISRDRDVFYTPDWVAVDMLEYFRPTGLLLDPCRGRGVFHDLLPEGSPWCEITEGVDFFTWTEHVTWVVGNPPYSTSRAWLNHSYKIADNVLYLMPIRQIFSGYGTLREIADFGGIRAIRLYGTGTRCGFPMGNAVGAIHIERGYRGPTYFTDQMRGDR